MLEDTGWVPERPGSEIMIRRTYNTETGVGSYEEKIPWKAQAITWEDLQYLFYLVRIE